MPRGPKGEKRPADGAAERRVALSVARRTGKRVGVDIATRMPEGEPTGRGPRPSTGWAPRRTAALGQPLELSPLCRAPAER